MWKPITKRRRDLLTRSLLALLLFGCYVPVGFMPAAGTPFLLELCPAAAPLPSSMLTPMSASMHAHHHQQHAHGRIDTCPFGSAPGSGPLSQHILFAPPPQACGSVDVRPDSSGVAGRTPRSHRARAPPSSV